MLAIYRHHIRHGIEEGVDDSGMPQPDDLRERRKNLRNRRLPHLVATYGGEVLGYAYVVLFRKRPAYRYTVKHSIYVHHEHQGRGVGRLLMHALIDACAAAGFRQMIGYIDADNSASLGLHEKFGFSGSACCPALPIDTADGPTVSWCSARLAPVQRLRHRPRPSLPGDEQAGSALTEIGITPFAERCVANPPSGLGGPLGIEFRCPATTAGGLVRVVGFAPTFSCFQGRRGRRAPTSPLGRVSGARTFRRRRAGCSLRSPARPDSPTP